MEFFNKYTLYGEVQLISRIPDPPIGMLYPLPLSSSIIPAELTRPSEIHPLTLSTVTARMCPVVWFVKTNNWDKSMMQ